MSKTSGQGNVKDIVGYVAAGCLFTVVVADLIYGVASGREALLTWTQIAFVAFGIFALYAPHITRFTVSPKEGVTIEKQVEAFEKDLKNIEAIPHGDGAQELESLLQEASRLDHTLWSQLIMYRLAMRALLRRLCLKQGMPLSDTHSMRSMLGKLLGNGTIPRALHDELERVRDATFPAEWGAGTLPSREELAYVVEHGPDILRQLQRIG
ncbi:MAG: hypothetical protein ACYTAS_16170 [Planctomycetota bacterium]